MAKVFDSITRELHAFIEAQQMFFVATAPLDGNGHVNLSPKGLATFRILSPNRVAYLDLTGSGNETSAHLVENGRITFMFCAFDGSPRILRLYGQGYTVLPEDEEWSQLHTEFEYLPGARQIIVSDITRVQTSCGFAVPQYEYVEQRDTLIKFAQNKKPDGLLAYRKEKNVISIDGLPTPIGMQQEPLES